jgi:hypothetical protein
MKCRECENAIYSARELSNGEKQKMEAHLQTCIPCQQLWTDTQLASRLVRKATQASSEHPNPVWLTNKIMLRVAKEHKKSQPKLYVPAFLNIPFIRYAMAVTSFCLFAFLLAELGNESGEPNILRGPIANLQGVILQSQDLKKDFTIRKEKRRARLVGCTSPLKTNVDVACLKEKIKNLNF